jgi:hypothetical protein
MTEQKKDNTNLDIASLLEEQQDTASFLLWRRSIDSEPSPTAFFLIFTFYVYFRHICRVLGFFVHLPPLRDYPAVHTYIHVLEHPSWQLSRGLTVPPPPPRGQIHRELAQHDICLGWLEKV